MRIPGMHTIHWGELRRLQGALSGDLGLEVGKLIIQKWSERVSFGAVGTTGYGDAIDSNAPAWEMRKRALGRETGAFRLYGDLSSPSAWDVSMEGNNVVLTLVAHFHDRWDTIHRFRRGRNWNEVYVIGPTEAVAANTLIHHTVAGYLNAA